MTEQEFRSLGYAAKFIFLDEPRLKDLAMLSAEWGIDRLVRQMQKQHPEVKDRMKLLACAQQVKEAIRLET